MVQYPSTRTHSLYMQICPSSFAGNNLTRMVGLRATCWQRVRSNYQKCACSNIVRKYSAVVVLLTVLLRGLACEDISGVVAGNISCWRYAVHIDETLRENRHAMFVNKVRHTFGIGIAFAFIFRHPCMLGSFPNRDQVCQLRTIFSRTLAEFHFKWKPDEDQKSGITC